MLFASGNKKSQYLQCFSPVPRNPGIYAVFTLLQEVLLPCQRHNNTANYSVLGRLLGFVEGAEGGEVAFPAPDLI